LGRTVLDILKEHPSQQSLQIAALLQGKSYYTFVRDNLELIYIVISTL